MPNVIREERRRGKKISVWLCHWCGRERRRFSDWHHTTVSGDQKRSCCNQCYNNENSNYRLVYGPDADQNLEIAEIRRATAP